MSIFEKFKAGFKKSPENFATGLKEIIIKKEIDDKSLDKIEEFLISSDVGIEAASEIKSIISQEKIDPNLDSIQEINKILKSRGELIRLITKFLISEWIIVFK